MNLSELKEKLDSFQNNLSKLTGEFELLSKQQYDSIAFVEENEKNKMLVAKAIEVLSVVQETTREKIKNDFETLISYILSFVTEEDYRFVLEFDKRGNLSEADFKVLPPGSEEAMDLIDQSGGGIADLVGFGLRVVLMECSSPKTEGFILGDESFKCLSANYQEKIPYLLEELNKRLNRQIIIVSHSKEVTNRHTFNRIEIV